MRLVERYNQILRTTEDATIQRLDAVLDASFNRLLRRVRVHMRAGYSDPAQRNLAILQLLRRLIPSTVRPEALDAYDRALRTLVTEAQRLGLLSAAGTTEDAMPTRPRVDVTIPLDATLAALQQAKTFLWKHGQTFAETTATLIAQGITEGRPTAAMVTDARQRLDVVKSRAETIVRTESLRAYNTASDRYYSAQGIDTVLYYATADDRSCTICAPRAGRIYRRGTVTTPLHPNCRCYLAPWSQNIAELDPDYAEMPQRHRKEVAATSRFPDASILNKRGVFEQITPTPLSV